MGKGGPKTTAGKAVVARNALRHGVLSVVPVLPEVEQVEAWDAHRSGLLASLSPATPMEQALVERIAHIVWRLGRLARYETALLAEAQASVANDVSLRRRSLPGREGELHADDLPTSLKFDQWTQRFATKLPTLPDAAPVSAEDAAHLLWAVARFAEVDTSELVIAGVPDTVAFEEWQEWTAGLLRAGVAAVAAQAGLTPAALLEGARAQAQADERSTAALWAEVEQQIAEVRGQRLLLGEKALDRVMRYEAHLQRQLLSTLAALTGLQAQRQAAEAPTDAVAVEG